MCGIAGIFQFETLLRPEALERHALAMARSMAYRGPDDEGVWTAPDAVCCLAHRRLSIIDPSAAGHQPMLSGDDRAAISFNGEIYNYEELRPLLESRGRRMRTRTDTEVLLEALREWGPLAFSRLDGMYAFALYDRENRELWLARDPFGEKPLYYLSDGKRLAFASELHSLQVLPFFDDSVSEEAMAEFLSFQYIGAPRTLYSRVQKLPPGCFMRVRAGRDVRTERYFEFSPGAEPGRNERSMDDWADELEEVLVRLLRRRLISDVPLGAFLSGGVDSSTVCALVRRKLNLPLETFSVGFVGSDESEHAQARKYAEWIGTGHHEKQIAPDATDFLLHAGDYLDEPNGDSSCLPTYLLSAFAREHVTVAISGDGGDEMFGGYGRYFVGMRKERRDRRKRRARSLGDLYYGDLILFFGDDEIRELFGRVPGELGAHLHRLRQSVEQSQGRLDLLMRMRKTDVDNYLPGAVLAKVDRMSMRHSLETRTPFLSIEMARFAERLPSHVLYRDGEGKLLLKHLAQRYLPREWLDLPKRGFGLPLTRGWGREQLLEAVSSLLLSESGGIASVIGRGAVERFLEQQRDPAKTHIYRLWAMGVLESYLQARPATKPRFEDVPEIRRLEVGSAHPMAPGLAREVDARSSEVFLLCRDGVPSWWRRLDHRVTVVAPFAVPPVDGLRSLQANWFAGDGSGLDSLQGRVPPGAVAVLVEPDAVRWLTPSVCGSLSGLGFDAVAVAAGEAGATVLSLAEYCELVRRCRRSWLRPGRRIGGWRGRFTSVGGHLYRGRWPLRFKWFGGRRQADRFAVAERRRPLLLAGAALDDIRDHGQGRCRVDERRVWFSASDNSDPGRNRRGYRLIDLRKAGVEPWWTRGGGQCSQTVHMEACTRFLDKDNAGPPDRGAAPRPGDTIALVTSSLHAGGAERQWVYLGRGLLSRGFRVVLFALDMNGENAHYLPLAQESSLDVRDLSRPASFPDALLTTNDLSNETTVLATSAPQFARRDLWCLTRSLRSLGADWVACQLDQPNLIGGLAGVLAGARRVLLSFRNVNPSNFSYLRVPWFHDYYRVLQRSRRVVMTGNSRFGNDDYAEWMGIEPARIRTIHNGFCTEAFDDLAPDQARALREELGIDPDARVVCGVFRLSEEKDPETFIEVAKHLVAARPDVVVLQVGSGPLLAESRRKVERTGLAPRIRFLGRRQDAGAIIGLSRLLLSTSVFEGLSNVLLEAQYLRVPIVATRAGGTPEALVDGTTGLLAPPGDAREIARRCLELLDDPERSRQMGQRGRRRVESEFSIDRLVDGTLEALASP